MDQLGYLDFDLLFEKSGEEYVVRVLNSPSGQASARFSLPFSPYEVENLLLRIGRTRKGVRRLESPEMEASRAFGSRLFSSVFEDEVLACLRSSLNTSYRKGMGLRLRLRLSQVPELLDLPWEFLFDPTRNQFMVLSIDTPLVRYLDLQQEVQPLAVNPPINVLAMISSPVDYPPLDVAREWEKLNEALGDLIKRDLVSLTRLEKADLGSLQRALRRGRYHVFHFIGHGGFDKQVQDGVLLTEGESGRGRPVSGYDLGTLLHDHRSLRLAVLNACEGARTSLTDPFAGTAQSLVQNGIPAVIAMQFEITDPAAILLAHEFYGALADGYPVDAALAEARKAIFAQGNDVEWATPVLYLRTQDATIFQIETAEKTTPAPAEKSAAIAAPVEKPPTDSPPDVGADALAVGLVADQAPAVFRAVKTPAQVKAEVDRLYTQGLSAFWLDEWGQAIQGFEAVLLLQPDHAEAASRLETARRNMELDRLYREAQAAEVAGDWRAAGDSLGQLVDLSPTYRDAQTRLEAARTQCELADLYAEARQLSQAGEWQAVVKIFDRIAEVDPHTQDPEGLLDHAREQLALQQKQAELEALYHRGVMAMDAGNWEEAATLMRQVQEQQPGYEQSERLLARAEAELDRQIAAAKPKVETAALDKLAEEESLYGRAEEAYDAGRWVAAVELLRQVQEHHPGYKQTEDLLRQAQANIANQLAPTQAVAGTQVEPAALEKQSYLESLYNRAVAAYEAGRWVSAAELLRQVEELQPGYMQTESLLRQAQAELVRQLEPGSLETPEAAPALPAQETEAADLVGQWQAAARLALRPALWLAGGWFLAGLAAFWWIRLAESSGLIERLADLTNYAVSYELIGYLQFILIFGPLSGLAIGIVLHRFALRLTRRQFLGLVIAWTAVGLLPAPFFSFGGITTAYILAWTLAGALGGLATYAVLRRGDARLNRTALVAIVLGWAIALALGEWYIRLYDQEPFHGWLHSSFGDFPDTGGRYLFTRLGNAVSGFIGGLATFAALFRGGNANLQPVEAGVASNLPAGEGRTDLPISAPPVAKEAVAPGASPYAGFVAGLRGAVRPALWLAGGWFLASLIAGKFFFDFQGTRLVNTINLSTGGALEYFDLQVIFTGLGAGLLCGLTLGLVLKRSDFNLALRHFLVLMAIWGFIILAVAALYAFSAPLQMLSWIIAGGIGGLLTYAVLRRTGADLNQQAQLWIILGWAIGLTVGMWFYAVFYDQYLFYWLKENLLGDNIWSLTEWIIALGIAITGFLGGLATFAALFSRNDSRTSWAVDAPVELDE